MATVTSFGFEDAFIGPGPDAQFLDHLRSGQFCLQLCRDCGRHSFPPRLVCPRCGFGAMEWRRASGRGTVYSTSVVRRRAERGGDYNVAIVELSEGPRMMTRVEGMAPEAVRIGMAVVARVQSAEAPPRVVFEAA